MSVFRKYGYMLFAFTKGSGAHVAIDILTVWNGGKHVKVHDKVEA